MTEPGEQLSASRFWASLRACTPARIGLGRTGSSLPTASLLDFSMAHARARDAVQVPLDVAAMRAALQGAGFAVLSARSQAESRAEYLRRPDLGRRLHPACYDLLACSPSARRLTVVVGDGLSSTAAERHAVPLLMALRARLRDWELDAVVLATQARVALADEIGALRGAEAVAILLGERPGLSANDSLGIYVTYAPRPGRLDAERNCISNVHAGGLAYDEAAFKLCFLLERSRQLGTSGVCIKDTSTWSSRQEGLP